MLTSDTLLQNRYHIRRQLGHGGMGEVYEATDERLDHIVAVKELIVEGSKLRHAFEREARLLAHLSHPSLPRVTDHFAEGAGHYLVMDFVPGDDLKAMLARRGTPFPVGDVLRWADELLEVLEYLHGHEPPVVHRDIKPANLKLLSNGRIVLLDFGLAKGGTGQTQSVTISRSVFGYSPHFASLEQMQGEKSSARSDLYSLSATLYYLLTGVAPCDALTRAAAVFSEEQDPLVPLDELNRDVPDEVARLIMSGLGLKTTARPTSAAEMRARMKNLTSDVPPGANDEVTRIADHYNAKKSETPDTSLKSVALASSVGFESRGRASGLLKYRAPLLAAAALCILAVISLGGYFLLLSRGSRQADVSVTPPDSTPKLPPQFMPASAVVLSLSATDANGQTVAGGGGFFVTATEVVVPLSAIEGATIASVSAGGAGAPRRVMNVTRVDRERGVVVVKVEGEGGAALNTPTGLPPGSGEKVKLLGLGADSAIRLADGIIVAPNNSVLEVHTTEQLVGPGWLALRESGEFIGLLTMPLASGDFALFSSSGVADLMKKKVASLAVEVAGAKDVLYDFRDATDDAGPPKLGTQEQAAIFDAVFGPRRPFTGDEDCEEEHDKCLAADRAAGRIEPEVLAKMLGSFTQPNTQQVAYLIAAHEEHSAHVDNFGTKRLAIFDGQRLVINVDIGDYWEIPKTFDLNHDGISELLLAGSYSQMGGTVLWAELVDLRSGKPAVVKDFDKVYMDDCAAIYQDTKMFGTLILYTPAGSGALPSGFRKDVYRSNCGANARWKYLVNGKVPAL